MTYLARVFVTLKPAVNDPQGLTVRGGLHALGFTEVGSVRAGKYLEVRLDAPPDVILTTPGRPLNCNFYQAIKPLIACEPLLAEGGVMALYAECCEGCGTEDMFIPYAGATCPAEVTERLKGNYKIQMDHALLLCKIMGRGLKIVVHSPHVEAAAFHSLFIEPAASPQAALDAACAMCGKPDPKVLIFPQPQRTLPILGRG